MKERLTKEEVLHVANLARLTLTENEIDEYAYKLQDILNSIDKIKDIEVSTDKILIAPKTNECALSKDTPGEELETKEVLKNAPHIHDTYIEVRGVFDE